MIVSNEQYEGLWVRSRRQLGDHRASEAATKSWTKPTNPDTATNEAYTESLNIHYFRVYQ